MAVLERELRRRVIRNECSTRREWLDCKAEERRLDMEEVRGYAADENLANLVEIVNAKRVYNQHIRWAALKAVDFIAGSAYNAEGLRINRFVTRHLTRIATRQKQTSR